MEDFDEFDRFWAFHRENSAISGPVGLADRFAAFRDSYAVLTEGAIVPDLISLDPHWGSNWRYRQLKEFWANAPPLFPFGTSASWKSTREGDGLFMLISRSAHILSWCAVIRRCVVHVLFPMERDLTLDEGRILELMVHCLADSLSQRKDTIAKLPLFQHRRINTTCHAHRDTLTTLDGDEAKIEDRPLFLEWSGSATVEGEITAHMHVNLRRVQQRVTKPVDARFEADATLAWIDGLNETLGIEPITEETRALIIATGSRRPRFSIKVMERHADVPQFASPVVPRPEHYKLARRDLAIVFKDLGVKEGRYELAAAKAIIDPARDRLRALVHERMAALRRDELVPFCIRQLDQLSAKYDSEITRVHHSLEHEVSYDRAERLAEAHGTFVNDSRNYRYLLECCLSGRSPGTGEVTERTVTELVATIDWLEVLYGASDVLHNGIDVAGVELDHLYIPHVFYSAGRDEREAAFATEMAELKLGVGVTPADAVPAIAMASAEWQRIDAAFADDVGVCLGQFLAGLVVLSRWPSANETADFLWLYRATREQLRNMLVESIEGLDVARADKVISLATLDPNGIRRLLGKTVDESDVPIWEHNKRGNRYTIKPLIAAGNDSFIWGAAAAERAARIWRSGIASGYLPAEFDWPRVSEAVRDIKEQLEEGLEVAAHRIVRRGTPFAVRGIDFKRRFPREGFEDVGDYDVLAFWPDKNVWLVVECKYNQPAFCLKDARRLRDRIFGTDRDRAQFAKIERRRSFLAKQADQLRALLAWPKPPEGIEQCFREAYVSRDIYWWMRNPPYNVPMQFIRVDVFDHWLRKLGLRT